MNPQKTIRDIFDNFSERQRETAYEMIGQALGKGDYNREALIMFNNDELIVMEFLLTEACLSHFKNRCVKL
jgi:hypothetical protein